MKGMCAILKLHVSTQLFLFGKKQVSKDIFFCYTVCSTVI